jgi:DNA-binding NarL/FixJ family response regulator
VNATLESQVATPLRVALVDGDEAVHGFVRETFAAHTQGWTLESHRGPDSFFAALCRKPRVPRSTGPQTQAHKLATPDAVIQHPVRRGSGSDVVLMEVAWPGLSGVDYVRRFVARLPNPRIVILTASTDRDLVVRSVAAGALGHLTKPVAPPYLVWAVAEVAWGRPVLCGQAQAAAVDLIHRMDASKRCRMLTSRERDILLLLMTGATNGDLARKLFIEEGTVRRHVHNILKKLGVHSKEEARRKYSGGELL